MNSYLLVYDRARGKLLAEREFSDNGAALKERFRLEREHMRNKDIEIVVLEADSAAAIRRTHARYFRTAAELIRDLADAFPER
ncbi:hypothetical protein [Actinoplanes sp. NPDC051411]|uniref:hypothetical protein n=1 Tax=Actinoplanes sp. NPDC051411 TaxID=3155522 RepID=UPI0034183EA3